MFWLRLISRLPFWVLYRLSDAAFLICYYLVRYRLAMVRRHLRNAFPEKSTRELRVIERRFYRCLCDYGVEMLKLLTISKSELCRRFVFSNIKEIYRYLDANLCVMVLAGHQFNWEWCVASGSAMVSYPVDFVYQRLSSKLFESFSLAARTRFGAHAIERKNVARASVARRRITRMICNVADQFPGYGADKRHEATFLGQPTSFFLGVNQLATTLGCAVFFVCTRRVKRGYYEAELQLIGEPPYAKDTIAVMENYVLALERGIRKAPHNWLWSHNRWKKRPRAV